MACTCSLAERATPLVHASNAITSPTECSIAFKCSTHGCSPLLIDCDGSGMRREQMAADNVGQRLVQVQPPGFFLCSR